MSCSELKKLGSGNLSFLRSRTLRQISNAEDVPHGSISKHTERDSLLTQVAIVVANKVPTRRRCQVRRASQVPRGASWGALLIPRPPIQRGLAGDMTSSVPTDKCPADRPDSISREGLTDPSAIDLARPRMAPIADALTRVP